jgi:hypothetical protein
MGLSNNAHESKVTLFRYFRQASKQAHLSAVLLLLQLGTKDIIMFFLAISQYANSFFIAIIYNSYNKKAAQFGRLIFCSKTYI